MPRERKAFQGDQITPTGRPSGRAVLFPAIVRAVLVLIGIPIVGGIPGTLQIGGPDRLRLAMRGR
jgi:hypothetical protein